MKKTLIVATVLALFAAVAGAQSLPFPCTLTIASGQSLSPAFTPTNIGTGCVQPSSTVFSSVLEILPMDAAGNLTTLDATSYGVLVWSCIDTAGAHCIAMQDAAGSDLLIVLKGGATPSRGVQLDPAIMAGGRTFKFQVVTSAGVGVAQTANRTFTLMVRPL